MAELAEVQYKLNRIYHLLVDLELEDAAELINEAQNDIKKKTGVK